MHSIVPQEMLQIATLRAGRAFLHFG
jgi:hypothetical protein